MKKFFQGVLAIALLLSMSIPLFADPQVPFLGPINGTLVTATPVKVTSLTGQSICATSFYGSGSFTSTFLVSNTDSNYVAAYTIHATSLQPFSTASFNGRYITYVGSAKYFEILPGTITGTVNYSISCSLGDMPIVQSGSVTVDGTGATGVAQDTGGSGAIGWLSSIVKNVRLIVTAIQGTLTVQFASAQHAIVDSGTLILGAGTAVIGHIIVDSGTVILGAGTALIGHVVVDSGSATISGTVTVADTYATPCRTGPILFGRSGATSNYTMITHSGSTSIYLCSLTIWDSGTGSTYEPLYGTGAACVTTQEAVFRQWKSAQILGITTGDHGFPIFTVPANKDLCMFLSGTTNADVSWTYAQQ